LVLTQNFETFVSFATATQIAELPKSMELRLRPVADNAALPMHDFRYENQAGIITAGLEC
jgi:hypothetical protein